MKKMKLVFLAVLSLGVMAAGVGCHHPTVGVHEPAGAVYQDHHDSGYYRSGPRQERHRIVPRHHDGYHYR